MKVIESSGATREEAIQNGLKELGVHLEEVERIDVIDEGSKGFLGLGKRPVRVRLSIEHAPVRERKGRERGGSGPDRHPSGQQGPNRGRQGEPRPQEKPHAKEQPKKSDRPKSIPRENDGARGTDASRGKRGGEERGRENRGGGKKTHHQDPGRNRDKHHPNKGHAPRHSEESRGGGAPGPRKAAPITGKSPSNVTEESLEAQRLADQFENIDLEAAAVAAPSLPENACEEENIEPITDEQGNEAAALLQEIINRMDLTANVSFVRAKDGSARLAVESGEEGGILIGKRGVTLEALQYLVNRMLPQNSTNENTERVVVDVGDYVDRRHAMLRDMALSMAEKAKSSGRNVRLKPLSPQERRIIHLTLEKDVQVRTYSTGDSLFRSVIINPVGSRRQGHNRQGRNGARRKHETDANSAPAGE